MHEMNMYLYPKNFLTKLSRCRHYSDNVVNILDIIQNAKLNQQINIKGWVKSLRKQKERIFIDLSDGSTKEKLQIVLPHTKYSDKLTTGASVSISGVLKSSPNGQIELNATEVDVYGKCVIADGYPFAPRKEYSPEYIRQYLHFRWRTNNFASLIRTRSAAALAIHNYLDSEGYINVHTPIITSNDCEGAGEVFKVTPESTELLKSMVKEGKPLEEAFFETKAFLTVSGQLQLESAAHGLSKVYTFGPTFRAENSRSRLHLSEFYMLEVEVAFLENLDDLMAIIEKLIKNVTIKVLDKCETDMNINQENIKPNFQWLNQKFPVITYDEAVEILKINHNHLESGYEPIEGISKEHELFLVKYCGDVPIFLVNWPKNIKPFYMREDPEDNTKVMALDLLVPGVGEIVGGSLRENDCEKLKRSHPHITSQLDWYLELRKFGSVPTGGFGLGFERYLLFLTGVQNIKDVIPFPRWPHNCTM